MRVSARSALLCATVALVLSSTGCQTYELGQVLPSPAFLRDDIQYFPKGTDFPLSQELNAMQAAEADLPEDLPTQLLVYDYPVAGRLLRGVTRLRHRLRELLEPARE